jgi:hypothetical protein
MKKTLKKEVINYLNGEYTRFLLIF